MKHQKEMKYTLGHFFFYVKNKCKCADRSHLAGIKSFLIAAKERGYIKEAGELIKRNNVHYCLYIYHSDFTEGKTGECL